MQKGFNKYYLIDLVILLISIMVFKNRLIYMILWLIIAIAYIIKYGIYRNKNYINGWIMRLSIICLISYFIVIYSLGLFTGFYRTIYNTSLIGIIRNMYFPITLIVCEEIVRYKLSKQCKYNIKPYILFTIILIILNILIDFSGSLNNLEAIFIFVCTIVLPTIASQSLYSYLSYNNSYMPNIIIRIFIKCYIFVMPILPGLGNYLVSVIGITYPLIIYLTASKIIKYYNKEKKVYRLSKLKFIYAPIICVLLILVGLVSGFFKYQLVAIASGSMEPAIYRGDAIIFEKTEDLDLIEIGTVVAYKKGDTIVTHRVVGIDYNKKIFKTKGDNNENIDDYTVSEDELMGIVKYNLKYIGYPTVWLSEIRK